MKHDLTSEIASRFAEIALGHVTREYPHKLDHVMDGPDDVRSPRELHPIFHGSFDWHSCVHGYWLLARLRRLYPEIPQADRIQILLVEMLADDEKMAAERAYFERKSSKGFERPYGWAWYLALVHELEFHHAFMADVQALFAPVVASRFKDYLRKLTYPIRVGTHFNTAFALILSLDWADGNDNELAKLIRDRAIHWFGNDRDCQAWEPGGDEFLSSALTEALLMRRCLGEAAFAAWFAAFLPRVARREPATLFTPATVSDRSDGKIAHLDGLNLSRAWCWRGIAPALPAEERAIALAAADEHLAAAMPHIAGDYMGEHWLASFALLALTA